MSSHVTNFYINTRTIVGERETINTNTRDTHPSSYPPNLFLSSLDLYDNTLIIFSSDNGAPDATNVRDRNWPLRGFKTQIFEGENYTTIKLSYIE